MAHFMTDHVHIHPLLVQYHVRIAPRRPQTTSCAFGAITVFLVFLRIAANDNDWSGLLPDKKGINAKFRFLDDPINPAKAFWLNLRTEIDFIILGMKAREAYQFAVKYLRIKEEKAGDDDEKSGNQ